MRITSIQLQAVDRPKGQTIEQVLGLIEQARGSDLVLLPEIWPTGYFRFDAYGEEAEPLDGPLVTAMGQAAKAIGAWLFMGSLVERSAAGLHNTSVLIRPDGQVACTYRKIHLFGHQSRERELLTAGHGVTVTQAPWGRVGLSTCYDLRFPELYRRMVDAGAEMFLVASAWPAARREAWRLFNQARAHENLA
ncbi:MAG: carbon-nitrogen family hydrolase, partial [Phycisphaeraceae bacterium]|nr:carbon-nitrogen family hydrolase [Phycisphaeraceae bacterium]